MEENKITFQVDGWLHPLTIYTKNINVCGKSVGMSIDCSENGGGVIDYNEVARLRNILGDWLNKVEMDGSYKIKRKEWDDKLKVMEDLI